LKKLIVEESEHESEEESPKEELEEARVSFGEVQDLIWLIVAYTSEVFGKSDKLVNSALKQLKNYFELKYGFWFTLPYSLAQIYHFPKAKEMWLQLTASSQQQIKSWDFNEFLSPEVQKSFAKFVACEELKPCIQSFSPLFGWYLESFGALPLHNNGKFLHVF
jgi:hypothetical protein